VSAQSFQLLGILPLGFIVVDQGPTSTIALYALVVTTIGGLIGRWLDNRKAEIAAKTIRDELLAHQAELLAGQTPLARQSTQIDTNAVAHRIEAAQMEAARNDSKS
jgi:energy-converting hydrogenase Eha subunit H